jgi:hypothetical protein
MAAAAQSVLLLENQTWAEANRHAIEHQAQGRFNEAEPLLHPCEQMLGLAC